MFDAVAQTIATIERTPTSLSVFLANIPGSWEAQIFMGLMLSGLLGMGAHYLVKWSRGEIKENLFCYAVSNGRKLLLSLLTTTGLAITAVMNDFFIADFGGFVGWKIVLWTGAETGFFIDVIMSKTDRARWSYEERIVRRKPRNEGGQ